MHAVLDRLTEFGKGTLDILLPRTYGHTAMWRPLFGLDRKKKIDRHTLSSTLWRLQSRGLVERAGPRRQSVWRVAPRGRLLQSEREKSLQRDMPKPDGITRLVIFDVPERERKKRDAIRVELIGYNFHQLQKSVWMGPSPLPKDFITLIDELNLGRYVHIFSVREKGTIKSR